MLHNVIKLLEKEIEQCDKMQILSCSSKNSAEYFKLKQECEVAIFILKGEQNSKFIKGFQKIPKSYLKDFI